MKKLTEMDNKELFSVLAGSDVIGQAYLKKVVKAYLKHAKAVGREEDVDLKTMVKEYMEGVYGEPDLES
ncbi:MAG: hypothetical protein K6F35_04260 [Lachnospiraceae bacterium]|nr:hypothetical protein [Lachnospiraceae bacterium]